MPKTEFNKQQSYLWSLVKQAGWNKAAKGKNYSRFSAYLVKTFNVTHANVLTQNQMRQAIATLKPYAAKAAHDQKKKLNQTIVAVAAKNGKDIHWVHENMKNWGMGESIRLLSYQETLNLLNLIRKALQKPYQKKGDNHGKANHR